MIFKNLLISLKVSQNQNLNKFILLKGKRVWALSANHSVCLWTYIHRRPIIYLINKLLLIQPFSFCLFFSGQLQQSSRQFGWHCDRRETGEEDLSIHNRVLGNHWSGDLVSVVERERRTRSRLRHKKHFDHGFHRGILVRGCNCDRGDDRRLQEKNTNGTILYYCWAKIYKVQITGNVSYNINVLSTRKYYCCDLPLYYCHEF